MKVLAFVEIWHPPYNVHFETVKEEAESEENAKEQFEELSKVISNMSSDSHNIVLETTSGDMIFTRKFLSEAILRLRVVESGEM